MAAINQARLLVRQLNTRDPIYQLGFPYLDTLKVLQKYDGNVVSMPQCSEKDLQDVYARRNVAAVFAEVPSNPLLKTLPAAEL